MTKQEVEATRARFEAGAADRRASRELVMQGKMGAQRDRWFGGKSRAAEPYETRTPDEMHVAVLNASVALRRVY